MAMRTRPQLTVQHPDAAGIDVGGKSHFVAVPPDRSETPVREFGCYTQDLHEMAAWMMACGVTIAALESTGVYWIPVYEVLEAHGIAVVLVNARNVKNVSGRKSDVLDCQWLQQLMSYGLLSAAFRPPADVCVLRAISRQRDTLLQEQARCVQRMQKSLTLMNIQLANAITDITGQTGLAIIRAIVAGERNPHELAKLRNYRIRSSEAGIAKSLEGTWKEEHLFCLAQALTLFDTHHRLIAEADAKLAALIAPLRQHRVKGRQGQGQAGRQERARLRRPRGPAGMGRGGFNPDWRHRREHRPKSPGGAWPRPVQVQQRQTVLLMAWPVSGDADIRGQAPLGRIQKDTESGGARPQAGITGAAS